MLSEPWNVWRLWCSLTQDLWIRATTKRTIPKCLIVAKKANGIRLKSLSNGKFGFGGHFAIYIYFTFKLLSLVTTALYHRFLQLVCFGLFLCEDLLHYPCNDAHQWDGCLGACRHHSHLYMLPMPLTTFLTKRWNLQWLLVCKHYEKTV